MLPNDKGTYILLISVRTGPALSIGKLGQVVFPDGWVAYVGSAHGPGGLRARVGRHLKRKKGCRWHIDYLTRKHPVGQVWYSTDSQKLECSWSIILEQMDGRIIMPGFGASDCKCLSHLFYFKARPGFLLFKKKASLPVILEECLINHLSS